MLCTGARPLFTLSATAHFAPRRLLHRRCHHHHQLRRHLSLSSTRIRISSAASPPETIEHIVLFNVKDGTDQTHLSAMLNGLNGLKSLDKVLFLTAGPVHRNRSTSLKFTHMLHSRYRTKEDLAQYSADQAHLDVVRSTVLPICDDLMAVDWVAHNLDGLVSPNPGSGMRVQFVKLKEGVGEREKEEVIGVIGGFKEKINGMDQLSVGENFSPARAKGFSIASIGVFPGIGELDSLEENVEIALGDKVRDYIDGIVVVDYVVPSVLSASL